MNDLTIIIPTLNERENVPILLEKLNVLLASIEYEVIIVDDNSKDKTWEVANNLKSIYKNLTVIRRINRNGLSSAVIEGFVIAESENILVMDADLQHDEDIIPQMLQEINNGYNVVIGSRYIDGGSMGQWGKLRVWISQFATKIAKIVLRHDIKDTMSGFFMVKKDIVNNCLERLSGKGFKILLDILTNSHDIDINVKEVPYTFKTRQLGESKLSSSVIFQFLEFLYLKTIGRVIPFRFFIFSLVGCFGAILHFLFLTIFYKVIQLEFNLALIIAIEVAIIFNYFFNNILTFKDKRIKGIQIILGLFSYNLITLFGGFINFCISNYLIFNGLHWIFSSLIGATAGVLWNYILTKSIIWRA